MKKIKNIAKYKSPVYFVMLKSGHGHYEIYTTYFGRQISIVTNNMPLIDRIKEGSETARNEAIRYIRAEHRSKTK